MSASEPQGPFNPTGQGPKPPDANGGEGSRTHEDDSPTQASAPEAERLAAFTDEPTVSRDDNEVAALRAEAADAREKFLRTAAELDNFRKRTRRDVDDAERRAREGLLRDLLPVFDNLERALVVANQATDVKAVADGVGMVLKQFTDTLERGGIKRVPTVGAPFDPQVHEAIQQIETADRPPGSVVAEVRAGYAMGDRLVRAAMVVVAKAPSGGLGRAVAMRRVIGIDLGTTNSCVACVEAPAGRAVSPRDVRVVPDREGSRTTPSIVGYLPGGERTVGHVAKRQAAANAEHTAFAVKRLMGRKFRAPEVQRQAALVPFDVAEAPNGDAWVRARGRDLSPPEVSAHVLEHLREAAEAFLGGRVTDAVIAVPAHFDDAQRQATKDAGRIAGLNVRRILNEPTAAALAYGLDRGRAERIAIYDLGGGTFDISVLELSAGVFGVKAVGGDTRLGGGDFDDRLLDLLAGEFFREHGVDLRKDRAALYRVREAVERAKHELSSALETDITLPFLTAGPSGPLHLERLVRRSEFEIMTRDLVERTVDVSREALAQARLSTSDVENVVLVGGMTRMPAVQRAVQELFGRDPHRGIDPDEVVAVGAALHAAGLEGGEGEHLLLDVTPLSVGVETGGGVFTKLIPRNTPIPTERSELFTTSVDDQAFVPVHVLQGERAMASDNQSLARFELTGIAPAPRGVPVIEVTFKVDVDGLVHVEARDVATGRRQSVRVRPSGGLSRSRIEQLVAEAERLREDDRHRHSLAELRQKAKLLLRSVRRSSPPPGPEADVERLAARLDALADDEDASPDELAEAYDGLERAASSLARPGPGA